MPSLPGLLTSIVRKKKLLEAGLIGLACWLWFLVTFVSFVCYICFKSFARVVLVGLVWFGLLSLIS